MPLMSAGTTIFLLLEWNEPGSWMKARQNLTSFISLAAYLRYQSSSADRAALGVRDQERQFAGGDDREAAGLIAGIDVSEVGDAVARHVVMVEGLAELLGRIDLVVQRAAGVLLDRGAPFFQRLLQRMRVHGDGSGPIGPRGGQIDPKPEKSRFGQGFHPCDTAPVYGSSLNLTSVLAFRWQPPACYIGG